MKRLVSGVANAVCVMASGAMAKTIQFRGAFCITSVTAGCTDDGWTIGCYETSRYSPRNLGDNGPSTKLSFFDTFSGRNYTLANGNLVGSTFRTVDGTGIANG